jgi:hypothetical protein
MTKLNNEICELNPDQLDRVSGGYEIKTAQQYASLLRVEVAEEKITRPEAERLLQTWELFQTAHKIPGRF